MKLLKSVRTICMQNLRKWKTDYRVWVIGVLALIMIWIYIDDMDTIVTFMDSSMPVWIFPFIYMQFHMKLIYTLPVILLFCNAPFIDANQTFVYMRSGRKRWLCGQILYVIMASGIYYLFLLITSFLSAIAAGGEISLEWGKTLTTIANSGVAGYLGVHYIDASTIITTYFSPISAIWFTFLLSWLCGTMIGLIIFFCNTFTGTRFLGITISSLLAVLSAAEESGLPQVLHFSPISWITLNKVDVGGLTTNPSFEYCIVFYLTAIILLAAGILLFGKKQSMDMKG